jgi:hypothetical protein
MPAAGVVACCAGVPVLVDAAVGAARVWTGAIAALGIWITGADGDNR